MKKTTFLEEIKKNNDGKLIQSPEAELTLVRTIHRPLTTMSIHLLNDLTINHPKIAQVIKKLYPKKVTVTDKARKYFLLKTPKLGMNDLEICQTAGITKEQSLIEIMATAWYVSDQFKNNQGPLYEVLHSGQENLNIGYAFLENEEGEKVPQVFWLEIKNLHNPASREAGMRYADVPRQYHPNRFMLVSC